MPHEHDGKVIVYAPFARDAESVGGVLAKQAIAVETTPTLTALAQRLGDDVGAVVMTEEALSQPDWEPLVQAAVRQPSWSAYPFILLIGQKRSLRESQLVYAVLPAEITNVMVLERPMGSATLISAVRWALGGRRRQFLTRNHLAELERKSQQQRLMTRELAHRVKNTIAVLQSIVTQTMRSHPDSHALRNLILERFGALSRAHDILLGTDFSAADFRELVEASLGVHHGNFLFDGASIRLSPQASLSFALVLHELATNSVKYGALKANGAVKVRWSVAAGPSPTFAFDWIELGGAPASQPNEPGFGTRLIKSTLGALGDVDLAYRDSGFALAFNADLRALTHAVVPDFHAD